MNTPIPTMQFDFAKPAEAVADYSVNWTDWLNLRGDAIATVVFTITPRGGVAQSGDCTLVPTLPNFSGGIASCWISGGIPGAVYVVDAEMVTTGANSLVTRTDHRQAILRILPDIGTPIT